MGVRLRKRKSKAQSYSVRVKTGKRRKSRRGVALPASKKTLIENYRAMGIELDPNSRALDDAHAVAGGAPQALEDIETVDAGYLQQLVQASATPKPQKQRTPQLPIDEYLVLRKLLRKYKEDELEKMEKDRKLNTLYWTANQISKKLKVFRLQEAAEAERAALG